MSPSGWRGHVRSAVGATLLTAVLGVSLASPMPGVALAQDRSAIRYGIVAEGTEVRYRVREQLAGLSFPNDAVGVTGAVEGSVGFDGQGRVLPDSRVTVDLRTLRSDEGRRDNYVRRNTLETDRFPTVTFVPTEVRRLPFPLPQTGSAPIELVGDLTVKDVTRRVTWEGTATFDGPRATVRARTAFRFGDFGLRVPRVSVVLSVEDDIKLEADLSLRRSS
jgi:polyisoprenoid-binding protein YceI